MSVLLSVTGAREYHVQFFSNEPERAWIHEKRMREYRGRKQYDQLVAEDNAKIHNQSERLKVRCCVVLLEHLPYGTKVLHCNPTVECGLHGACFKDRYQYYI